MTQSRHATHYTLFNNFVDGWLGRLKPRQVAVWFCLLRNSHGGECCMSLRQIAECVSSNSKTVSWTIHSLENLGLLTTTKKGGYRKGNNTYMLHVPIMTVKKPNPVSKSIQELRSLPYEKYLLTDHWQSIRRGALRKAAYKCQLCSVKNTLQVHHNTYDNLGCEKPEDVTVLCNGCHEKHHEIPSSQST